VGEEAGPGAEAGGGKGTVGRFGGG
jgi:hypothetical protein